MPTLELRSLTKCYGLVVGIQDVSFTLDRGEVFGYLGPNGAGKTTTLRCIMGFIQPARGDVIVLGQRVAAGRATRHARLGYLPGEFRLWPRCRVRHALGMLARMGDDDGADARREELAARLELDLDRPFGTLSKGNRQKVAVIQAFQHQPELLLLDEPTSGLDPLMRQVVLDLIRDAAAAGATVLLSSHDLNEVSAVCGRAGILREGRLVQTGPISSIVRTGERRLKVWFADGVLRPVVPLDRLPGVRVIEQRPGLVHLAYQGTCDAVLQWIASFPVDRIATPETSLEEAFLQYYNTPPPAAAPTAHTPPEGPP
ncbi:MAG: ABC transporter ATP-binding protein [Verrucomicrobia bacterium]|nr:ABC transporter ATP-binding protein [Verrucomicrobiota bacterium]